MDGWLWRRVRRRLDRVVPSERSAAVIGDLQEDYARRRAASGPMRAAWWLWRESRSLERAYRAANVTASPAPRQSRRLVLGGWSADGRIAVRRLRASPSFTTFAILTLGLGIGATTAIYSVIRAAMSPPSGVTTLDRLVTITHSAGGSVPMIALSWGDFQDLRARQTTLQDVAGWTYLRVSYGLGGQTGSGWGERVTGEYFQVLGVRASLGRPLQPADDDPAAVPVAVVSHRVWQRVFGGAPDIIGRLIKINGATFEVIGVAAPDFAGLFNSGLVPTAVWLPLASSRTVQTMSGTREYDSADRASRSIQVRARLKDGVTVEAARADVTRIAQQLDQTVPLPKDERGGLPYRSSRPWVLRRTADTSLNEGADDVVSAMAATVMAAVGLVLLVACTNLANLMLARGSGRRAEIALRLALGASRGRLVRGELAESLLIGAAGGIVGLGVARVILVLLGNDVPVGNDTSIHFVPRIDAAVLAISGAATLLSVLVAGLLPAWQSTRADVRASMASAALPRWRGRRMLIAAQVTVSMILVALAGLCVSQLRAQGRVDLGIDQDRIALAEVNFAIQQYPEARVREMTTLVLGALARRPDVTAVSASSGLPLGITTPGGYVGDTPKVTHFAELLASTPGILDTLGVSILKGRALSENDTAGSAPVAVISEATARTLFGTADVVGRSLFVQRRQWAGEPEHPVLSRAIVGVASDTAEGGQSAEGSAVYVPFSQQYEGRLVISARTDGDPAVLVPAMRQALAAIDSNVVVAQASTGPALLGQANLFLQITAGLTGILGGFALALALAGLYGALSHVVHRRRREIGVRLALGASRRQILRMVLRDGLRPVIAGVALGLVLGAVVRLALEPLFHRLLPPLNPFVLVVVPALLVACGVAACLIPARRASGVDPNLALRDL